MANMMSQRSVTIEEVSLVLTNLNPTERTASKLISSLSSIMRVWAVKSLDLTEIRVEGCFLVSLLGLDRHLYVRSEQFSV